VGAHATIWDLMREARREGLAVLLISADLEELIGLSDTIKVIFRGRLSSEFDPDQVTAEQLGAAMTGADTSGGPNAAGGGGQGEQVEGMTRAADDATEPQVPGSGATHEGGEGR